MRLSNEKVPILGKRSNDRRSVISDGGEIEPEDNPHENRGRSDSDTARIAMFTVSVCETALAP
jgi:hypothetical protein